MKNKNQFRHYSSRLSAKAATASMMVILLSLFTTSLAQAALSPQRQQELLHLLRHDCGSCHGMTLRGGLGPALLPANLAGKSDEFLVTTLLEGRMATAMPPWRGMLSHEEAEWLIKQLRGGVSHAE